MSVNDVLAKTLADSLNKKFKDTNKVAYFLDGSDTTPTDIKEFISDKLVDKMCLELSEFDFHGLIIISGFVEPMLDKNIFNIISKFRKNLPKSKIEITTNGDVLNISRIKKLFISGSIAEFFNTVLPLAKTADIINCEVAPTLILGNLIIVPFNFPLDFAWI